MFKFRKPSICSSVSPELDVLGGTSTDTTGVGGSTDRKGGRAGQGDSVTESRFSVLPPTTKEDDNYDALSAHQHYLQTRGERRGSGSSCSNASGLSDSTGSLLGKVVLDRKRKERHESTSQGQEKKVIRSVSDDECMNECDRNGDFRRTLSHDSFNTTKQKEDHQFLTGMRKPAPQDFVDLAGQSGRTGVASDFSQNGPGNLITEAEPQFDVMRKITTSENYEPELQRQLERSANWSTAPPPVKKTHKRRHRSSKRQSRTEALEKQDEEPLEVDVAENGDCADVELASPNGSDSLEDDMCADVDNETGNIPTVEIDEVEDVTSQTSDRLMALDFTNVQQQQHQKSVISMLAQFGGTSADDEVMLSPRNSVLGKEGIDIPPSPPLHAAPIDPPISRQGYLDGNPVQKMNDLSRQITALKRHLKGLESEYEQVYGYRPSHSDKLNNKEMRKCVLQLTKAKKELKQIREDPSCLNNMSNFSGGVSGNILCVNRGNSIPPAKGTPEYAKYLEATVREIERTLSEKRRAYNRPDELEQMDALELQEEKCLMQRQLLVLEKRHGRPGSKLEKDIVRPLYERYRAIKRFSVKVVCVRENGIDLPPIIEGEPLEFSGDTPEHTIVTRANVVTEILQNGDGRPVVGSPEDEDEKNDFNSMTLGELETNLRQAKDEKRRMRAVIRKFETDFQNVAGRPPQKDEKYSSAEMELAYQKYKRIKATVRLLDVLINKRRVPALIADLNRNDD